MCYSAMVKQNLKQLSLQFNARIDYNAFSDLFQSRLEGNKITVSKALEYNFLHDPHTSDERKMRDLIIEYSNQQQSKGQLPRGEPSELEVKTKAQFDQSTTRKEKRTCL